MLREIQPVLMVRDVRAAVGFFGALGFARKFGGTDASPDYAGVRRDGVEIHLQWQDEQQWKYGIDRPTYRILVFDVNKLYAELSALNLPLDMTTVGETEWGTREFHLRDPDGNGLQFYQDV